MNSARATWLSYGRALAERQAERLRVCAEQGIPAPTPRQVRADFIRGTSAGANARRWLTEGWRQFELEGGDRVA